MQLTTLTKKSVHGFTLIELLVVIAIIGLLSTIVAAPIQSARKKAKDTKKLAEIRTLQTSLANYANDNGSYPMGTTTLTLGVGVGSALTILSPQYIPSIPNGFTSLSTRDKYMYVAYHGIAPGATATTTFGYHLGSTLEVYNSVLVGDDDCWGAVSTTSPNITGNKNGGGCMVFVSADKTSLLNAAYLGATSSPVAGSGVATRSGITSVAPATTTFLFSSYVYLSHPQWQALDYDFQGKGVNEGASSSCTTVDQCIYDVSDVY